MVGGGPDEPQERVDLADVLVDLDQLFASLPYKVVAEAVAAVHLEQQAAEVSKAFLPKLEQRAPLTPEHA